MFGAKKKTMLVLYNGITIVPYKQKPDVWFSNESIFFQKCKKELKAGDIFEITYQTDKYYNIINRINNILWKQNVLAEESTHICTIIKCNKFGATIQTEEGELIRIWYYKENLDIQPYYKVRIAKYLFVGAKEVNKLLSIVPCSER